MPTVSFHTLGCKLNFAETATVVRQFTDRQFAVVPFGKPADVIVINTCSVTDEADRKCRQTIRRAVRADKDAFVIVTGCYAQLKPEEVAAIPGVDAVLGTGEKLSVFTVLDSLTKREQTQISVSCIDAVESFGPAFSAGERTRAFLKVQDGCDYSCAFCTIPMARGRSRSHSIAGIVAQANEIAERGHREIVLSGVNIGLFGEDSGETLLELLRQLDNVDGIKRYRVSSIEPNLLTNSIVEFVSQSKRFMPHFHIPLQSGDDFVLGKMRRRYLTDQYQRRVRRIRDVFPSAGIGADVIVGFPAETPERFETTRRFIADLPLTYLHVFTYSERAGTAAVDQIHRMGGTPVLPKERSRRNRVLRLLSDHLRNNFAHKQLGEVRPVLWESKVNDGRAFGFTDNYIRVSAPASEVTAGEVQPVLLAHLEKDGSVSADIPGFLSLASAVRT